MKKNKPIFSVLALLDEAAQCLREQGMEPYVAYLPPNYVKMLFEEAKPYLIKEIKASNFKEPGQVAEYKGIKIIETTESPNASVYIMGEEDFKRIKNGLPIS